MNKTLLTALGIALVSAGINANKGYSQEQIPAPRPEALDFGGWRASSDSPDSSNRVNELDLSRRIELSLYTCPGDRYSLIVYDKNNNSRKIGDLESQADLKLVFFEILNSEKRSMVKIDRNEYPNHPGLTSFYFSIPQITGGRDGSYFIHAEGDGKCTPYGNIYPSDQMLQLRQEPGPIRHKVDGVRPNDPK